MKEEDADRQDDDDEGKKQAVDEAEQKQQSRAEAAYIKCSYIVIRMVEKTVVMVCGALLHFEHLKNKHAHKQKI